jgi:hypothetical protein
MLLDITPRAILPEAKPKRCYPWEMIHPARLSVEQLLTDCRLVRTRRSGPGGQHRNKVETAVVVEHLPTGMKGEASERRSQLQNRQTAIQRLRVQLALVVRHAPSGEPSATWRERVNGGRISVSTEHTDYPALLAEALDVVHAHGCDAATAAVHLRVSSSQLVKLLKTEHAALQQVNLKRQSLDLPPLR